MDYAILMNWMSPFPTLGVSGVLFHFYDTSNKNSSSQQCRPWSDAVFCGIWSMSALSAYVSKLDARYKWVLKLKMPNITWASPEQGPYHIGKQGRLRQAWASVQSDQSLCCALLHAHMEDSDQTGWMPRLIWGFAGRTCHLVGFMELEKASDKVPHLWPYPMSHISGPIQWATSLALSNEPHLWPYPMSHISGPIQWGTTNCYDTVAPLLLGLPHNKTPCAPTKTQISLGIQPVWSVSVFAVRMKKAWVLSYPLSGQRRLWSDWADAQADLRLRWAHSHFVCFVMRRPTCQMAHLLSKWLTIFLVNESCSKQHHSMHLFHFTQFTDQQEISRNLSNMLNIEIQIHIWLLLKLLYEPHYEKICFCHMRTKKVQISLRIRAVWSVPLLFAAWIVQYLFFLNSKFQHSSKLL